MSYPNQLDVFTTLVDGFHPIAAEDWNEMLRAIERIEKALGWGKNLSGGGASTTYGPAGPQSTVKDRLDQFLDKDGSLIDCVSIVGSGSIGEWSGYNANGGKIITFPKPITKPQLDGYVVLVQTSDPYDEGSSAYTGRGLGPYVVTKKASGYCVVGADYDANGSEITENDGDLIDWQVLVIGDKCAS